MVWVIYFIILGILCVFGFGLLFEVNETYVMIRVSDRKYTFSLLLNYLVIEFK